jgi:hypothetical protein
MPVSHGIRVQTKPLLVRSLFQEFLKVSMNSPKKIECLREAGREPEYIHAKGFFVPKAGRKGINL